MAKNITHQPYWCQDRVAFGQMICDAFEENGILQKHQNMALRANS
jgi:hypothetical protein